MKNKEYFLCLCCGTEMITGSAQIEVIGMGDLFECMVCEKCGERHMSSEQMDKVLKKKYKNR